MAVRKADVVLVGGGVMSATLGMMLRQLDPSLDIVMVERLDHVAHESTDGWNNAGTGHAGYCELNYTPETDDGDVEIEKAWSCMLCVLGRSLAGILINNKAEVPRLSQEGKG